MLVAVQLIRFICRKKLQPVFQFLQFLFQFIARRRIIIRENRVLLISGIPVLVDAYIQSVFRIIPNFFYFFRPPP